MGDYYRASYQEFRLKLSYGIMGRKMETNA